MKLSGPCNALLSNSETKNKPEQIIKKGKPRAQGEEEGMEVHIEREGRPITAEDEDELERNKERWRWGEETTEKISRKKEKRLL